MNLKDKYKRNLSYTQFHYIDGTTEVNVKVHCRHLQSRQYHTSGGFDVAEESFVDYNYFDFFTCALKPNKIPNCFRCIYSTHHNEVECFMVKRIELLLKEDLS